MSEGEGGFLGRWSRRKIEAKKEAETPVFAEDDRKPVPGPDVPAGVPVATSPAGGEGEAGAARAGDAEETFDPTKLARPLPSLDEIVPGMDMTPFFQQGVPEMLRNAALRKLWVTDPMIRDFENPAREYAYDWNVPGGVPGSGELVGDHDAAELLRSLVGGKSDDEKSADEMTQISPEESVEHASAHAAPAQSEEDGEPAVSTGALPDKGLYDVAPAKAVEVELEAKPSPVSGKRRHGGAMPA